MQDFESKILKYSDELGLFAGAEKLLIAVSGGMDSVALFKVIMHLKKSGYIAFDVALGHINHNLRGEESDADEAFVRELACAEGVEFFCESVDVLKYSKAEKVSIETAARMLRHEAFRGMVSEIGGAYVVLAHHLNDNVETIIHRLQRGTGIRGLAGISPKCLINGMVLIRPMLCVKRAEIEAYCDFYNISWRHDKSNDERVYTRNFIRHEMLPLLESECEGDLFEAVGGLAERCGEYAKKLDEWAENAFSECLLERCSDWVVMDVVRLKGLRDDVRVEVYRRVFARLGVGEKGLGKVQYNLINGILRGGESGRWVDLYGGVRGVRYRDELVLGMGELDIVRGEVEVEKGDTVTLGCWGVECRVCDIGEFDFAEFIEEKKLVGSGVGRSVIIECFDADKIVGRIRVRNLEEADEFWPIGGKGKKKVSKFLSDGGAGWLEKRESVVVFDDEKILWLVPMRISEEAKVSSETKRLVVLRVDRKFK